MRPRALVLAAGRVGDTPNPPLHPTLIYDDTCGFCRRWVGRARRWDHRGVLRFVPLQEPAAVTVSGRSPQELGLAMHVVRPDGAVYAGAAAAREYCRYVRGGKVLLALSSIPGVMPIGERVYRWVARRWGPVSEEA